ncbi:MAG: Yip1 family protein [Desulfotomaculaceae bacterium]|nr:Yip1 family protein [Desulfotomaculaceae bacterium]MDD4767048.1 Yip1 family protein [Desulfotomaculaceae bacterium]
MSGDAGRGNEHSVVRDEMLEAAREIPQLDDDGLEGAPQGFLEIVYGVLFDPVKTMQQAAEKPPLVAAFVIVTILSLLGTIMGLLTFARVFTQSLDSSGIIPATRSLVPVVASIGLVISYIKWFGYSAILHLVADLLGGRGGARGVFAAVGLAGLPHILLTPFQFLGYWYGLENLFVSVLLLLAGLAIWIWSSIILVVGLRETHRLSTGRSVIVFVIPYFALFLLLILSLIALAVTISLFPLNTNIPGYF